MTSCLKLLNWVVSNKPPEIVFFLITDLVLYYPIESEMIKFMNSLTVIMTILFSNTKIIIQWVNENAEKQQSTESHQISKINTGA